MTLKISVLTTLALSLISISGQAQQSEYRINKFFEAKAKVICGRVEETLMKGPDVVNICLAKASEFVARWEPNMTAAYEAGFIIGTCLSVNEYVGRNGYNTTCLEDGARSSSHKEIRNLNCLDIQDLPKAVSDKLCYGKLGKNFTDFLASHSGH